MLIPPSPLRSNAAASFETHSNYLKAFAALAAGSLDRDAPAIYDSCATRISGSGCLPTRQLSSVDEGQLRRCLEHAWGTELIMAFSSTALGEELVKMSAPWAAIQAYYCLYHGTQAVHVADGQPRPHAHPATHKIFADKWGSPGVDLAPWSITASHSGYQNVPSGVTIDVHVKPIRQFRADDSWSLVCKVLATTRSSQEDEQASKARESAKKALSVTWEEDERVRVAAGKKPRKRPTFPTPRLSPQERATAKQRVRPISMIHYLYRLRLRANYVDAGLFTEGPGSLAQASDAVRCLRIIAGTTLLLCEMSVSRRIGKPKLTGWIQSWARRHVPDGFNKGVQARIDILNRHC